jgi:hypothetical protein
MPNPGKSQAVKQVIGSRNQLQPVVMHDNKVIPEPPRRLDESGLRLWNEAWRLGWLSVNADIEAVALLCERMDERDQLRSFVLDNVEAWRERASLRKLEEQIEASMKSLILTPEARIKAGVNEVKTQTKLEQLMALKAKKQDG